MSCYKITREIADILVQCKCFDDIEPLIKNIADVQVRQAFRTACQYGAEKVEQNGKASSGWNICSTFLCCGECPLGVAIAKMNVETGKWNLPMFQRPVDEAFMRAYYPKALMHANNSENINRAKLLMHMIENSQKTVKETG